MPIAESRCDYDTNIIRRFARSIKFYSVPIGPVSFLILHACSEFRSPEIRGEERTSAGRKNRRGSEEEEEKEGEGEGEGEWKNRETGRALRRDREGEG